MAGIITAELTALKTEFRKNPKDIGVGLYNPMTGEIHLGSFDIVTKRRGHQGLATVHGITNNSEWRGFMVTSAGQLIPNSHFNLPDGSAGMNPMLVAQLEIELRQAGVIQ